MDDKRNTEILERRITDLENVVRELRQGMDGMEFAQIAITKRGDPVYVRTGKFSPAMGVQNGEYQQLLSGSTIEEGASEGDMTYWDGSEWVTLSAPLVKSYLIFDPDATPKLQWITGETFACGL